MIVIVAALCAGAAVAIDSQREDSYATDAQVLLRPNDPVEQPGSIQSAQFDYERYARSQADVVLSDSVVEPVAAKVGVGADDIRNSTSVTSSAESLVLTITSARLDPRQAADTANGLAESFIADRRRFASRRLRQSATVLTREIRSLRARVTALRAEAGAGAEAQINALEDVIGSTTTRRQDLLLAAALQRGQAEVLQSAGVPTEPTGPSATELGIAGGVLGAVLGFGLALLRDRGRAGRAEHEPAAEAVAPAPVAEPGG